MAMQMLYKHQPVKCTSCNLKLCVVKSEVMLDTQSVYCEKCYYGRSVRSSGSHRLKRKEDQLEFLSSAWDPSYADVLIQSSDGQLLQAHSAVLAGKSTVFSNMLIGSRMTECGDGVVKVEDMSYEELEKLVQFLYTASISSKDLEKHSMAFLQAAEKYDIEALKSVCEDYLAKPTKESILERACSKSESTTILRFSAVRLVLSCEYIKDNSLTTLRKSLKTVSTFEEYKLFKRTNPTLFLQAFEALVQRFSGEPELDSM